MPTITTALDSNATPTLYIVRSQLYLSNDSDKLKNIDPVTSAAYDAGLASPSGAIPTPVMSGGGAFTAGAHRWRYRWRSSKTGYVSNASDEASVAASASQQATITFSAGQVSADARVDQILVEATPSSSADWYLVGTRANSAGTVVVSMSDTTMVQQTSVSVNWGGVDDFDSQGHGLPPVCAFGFEHDGLHIVGGCTPRFFSVTMTNGSPTVTGTGFSANWSGRRLIVDGESGDYGISAITATTITLAKNYTGTTGTKTVGIFAVNQNRVYWSLPGYHESFDQLNRARDTLRSASDYLTSGISFGGRMYFFGANSAEYWTGNTDPALASAVLLPGLRGNFNPRTLVSADGVLYAWDRMGIHAITGGNSKGISDAIDPLLADICDYSKSNRFHAVFDPVDRSILFFFVRVGDTEPKWAAVFDTASGRWSLSEWLQGITASTTAILGQGEVRAVLADENGYTWYYGINDFYDGHNIDGVRTVNGSPSTTVIPVVEPVPASDFAGVMLYHPSSGESRAISSVATNSITVATAFTEAPAVGDEVYIGPIRMTYTSKWWVGGDMAVRKRPMYLCIKSVPSTAGSFAVRFYGDFSSAALPYTRGSSYKPPRGVTLIDGSPDATIDLAAGRGDGVVMVPVPAGWHNTVRFELEWARPQNKPRLIDADFVAAEGEATRAD